MTQDIQSPQILDSPDQEVQPFLDPKDLDLKVNEVKKPRVSKAKTIRGHKIKGTRARKGPRPSTHIEWARPHLYTTSNEIQTEAEAKGNRSGPGRKTPETDPVHSLVTDLGLDDKPNKLDQRKERQSRYRWTVVCFMINATAFLIKLGDVVDSLHDHMEGGDQV